MKNRILALIACGALAFSIAGCGESEKVDTSENQEEKSVEDLEDKDEEESVEDIVEKGEEESAEDSEDTDDEETFVESSNNDEVFIEAFNTDPTIEETVLWDEQDVKVTATSLTYSSWSASLNVTLENHSDKTLSFVGGSTNYCWYAINGYSITGGYVNEEVEPGGTVEASLTFRTDELSVYGINEIADIELSLEAKDEDDNTIKLPTQKIETSIASTYDYSVDTYQEILENGKFEQIGNCKIDYLAYDQLFSSNGISIESEAVVESKNEDYDLLGLMIEMDNQSDYNIYAIITDITLNGDLVYGYLITDANILQGTRGVLEFNLYDVLNRAGVEDGVDVSLIDGGFDSIESIGFTLNIRDGNNYYQDALTPQEITIDFN